MRLYRLKLFVVSSFWVIPGLFVFGALALWFLMPRVYEQIDVTWGVNWSIESVRSSLFALASGMIAFTGFVISGAIAGPRISVEHSRLSSLVWTDCRDGRSRPSGWSWSYPRQHSRRQNAERDRRSKRR